MKQVIISDRDLKVMLKVDGLSADEIAMKLSFENNVHINGEDVVLLIRERNIQQKNIKRAKNYEFVNPENLPLTSSEQVKEMFQGVVDAATVSAEEEFKQVNG